MGVNCSSNQSASNQQSSVPYLKIALVGDPEVGKTCIMLRYLKNQFSPMYIPTKKAVIESAVKKVNVPGHVVVSLTFWDIPGREDIDLHRTYFRNLDAAIVVVDMTDSNSVEMAPVWKQTILNNTFVTHPVKEITNGGQMETKTMEETPVDKETFPVLLLGNKFDVIEQRVQVERLKKLSLEKKHERQSESGDSTEKERIVWSVDGPLTEEEKPESVKMLEKIATDNNFHGSMMVSARDGDGSVKEAIQYLIRHLLETKYAVKKWKLKDKKEKKKTNKIIEYGGLDMIDVKQFDDVFKVADVSVKKVAMLRDYHNKSLMKLKEACMQAQILKSGENSLEDCIMAIKRNIAEGAELKVKKDEEFCKLEVVSKDKEFKLPRNMKNLLKVFHNEFAAVCKAIMNECPPIEKNIHELDEQIAKMCNECWDAVAMVNGIPRTKADINAISSTIEQNRAKMQHAVLECRVAVDIIEDAKVKIKAAFIW